MNFNRAKREQIVALSKRVLADDFDSKLAAYFEKTSGEVPLLIDFADAIYVDVAALVNCIALLTDRRAKGLETKVGLPKDRAVLDFFRVWRFLEAIAAATRTTWKTFVLASDLPLLDGEQSTYTGIGGGLELLEFDPDWIEGSTRLRNFFEFVTFSHPAGERIQPAAGFSGVPRALGVRWSGALIQQVLRRHLGEGSSREDIARVLLYESIGNAVRHPDAGLIQVVSRFNRPALNRTQEAPTEGSPPRREGSLRICVWDDGKGIAETLRPVAEAGKSIRAFGLPSYMCDRIRVEIRRFDETITRTEVVDEGDPLTSNQTAEARLLLASLYPGVSRDVDRSVPNVEPYDDAGVANVLFHTAPGMGLYALRRTVLDQFQGQILIRSGRYRLLMEMAHDTYRVQYNARYKAKITAYPKSFPAFRGNLLAIDLPLRAAASEQVNLSDSTAASA